MQLKTCTLCLCNYTKCSAENWIWHNIAGNREKWMVLLGCLILSCTLYWIEKLIFIFVIYLWAFKKCQKPAHIVYIYINKMCKMQNEKFNFDKILWPIRFEFPIWGYRFKSNALFYANKCYRYLGRSYAANVVHRSTPTRPISASPV